MKNEILRLSKNVTVLILCGGKGLRLRPLTKKLPKPLIKIKNKTILENIIDISPSNSKNKGHLFIFLFFREKFSFINRVLRFFQSIFYFLNII